MRTFAAKSTLLLLCLAQFVAAGLCPTGEFDTITTISGDETPTLAAGSVLQILWSRPSDYNSYYDNITDVQLGYVAPPLAIAAGVGALYPYTKIADSIPRDPGQYSWTVPSDAATDTLYRFRLKPIPSPDDGSSITCYYFFSPAFYIGASAAPSATPISFTPTVVGVMPFTKDPSSTNLPISSTTSPAPSTSSISSPVSISTSTSTSSPAAVPSSTSSQSLSSATLIPTSSTTSSPAASPITPSMTQQSTQESTKTTLTTSDHTTSKAQSTSTSTTSSSQTSAPNSTQPAVSSSTASADQITKPGKKSLSTGAIVGIALGAIVGLLLLLLLAYWLHKRQVAKAVHKATGIQDGRRIPELGEGAILGGEMWSGDEKRRAELAGGWGLAGTSDARAELGGEGRGDGGGVKISEIG